MEEVRNIGNLKFIKLHTVDEDLQVIIKKKEVSKEEAEEAEKDIKEIVDNSK